MSQVEVFGDARLTTVKCDMANVHGPWWANTWWAKRTATVNISIVVVLMAFLVWKALVP